MYQLEALPFRRILAFQGLPVSAWTEFPPARGSGDFRMLVDKIARVVTDKEDVPVLRDA